MLTISPERMLVQYSRKKKLIKEDHDEIVLIEDLVSFKEELDIIEENANTHKRKIIKHSRKQEVILEHHINNYIGNSTLMLIEDISEDESIELEVDDAFEAFLASE